MKRVMVSRRQILKGLAYSGVAALAGVPLSAVARGITRQIERTDLLDVCVNGKYGFINHSGSIVIKPRFEATWGFTEGLACVKWDGKFGFIDQSGDIKINPVYDFVGNFSEGLAFVTLNIGKASCFGFVDSSGEMVIQPREYSMVSEFKNGIAWVTTGFQKSGYINRRGEYVWEPTQ